MEEHKDVGLPEHAIINSEIFELVNIAIFLLTMFEHAVSVKTAGEAMFSRLLLQNSSTGLVLCKVAVKNTWKHKARN